MDTDSDDSDSASSSSSSASSSHSSSSSAPHTSSTKPTLSVKSSSRSVGRTAPSSASSSASSASSPSSPTPGSPQPSVTSMVTAPMVKVIRPSPSVSRGSSGSGSDSESSAVSPMVSMSPASLKAPETPFVVNSDSESGSQTGSASPMISESPLSPFAASSSSSSSSIASPQRGSSVGSHSIVIGTPASPRGSVTFNLEDSPAASPSGLRSRLRSASVSSSEMNLSETHQPEVDSSIGSPMPFSPGSEISPLRPNEMASSYGDVEVMRELDDSSSDEHARTVPTTPGIGSVKALPPPQKEASRMEKAAASGVQRAAEMAEKKAEKRAEMEKEKEERRRPPPQPRKRNKEPLGSFAKQTASSRAKSPPRDRKAEVEFTKSARSTDKVTTFYDKALEGDAKKIAAVVLKYVPDVEVRVTRRCVPTIARRCVPKIEPEKDSDDDSQKKKEKKAPKMARWQADRVVDEGAHATVLDATAERCEDAKMSLLPSSTCLLSRVDTSLYANVFVWVQIDPEVEVLLRVTSLSIVVSAQELQGVKEVRKHGPVMNGRQATYAALAGRKKGSEKRSWAVSAKRNPTESLLDTPQVIPGLQQEYPIGCAVELEDGDSAVISGYRESGKVIVSSEGTRFAVDPHTVKVVASQLASLQPIPGSNIPNYTTGVQSRPSKNTQAEPAEDSEVKPKTKRLSRAEHAELMRKLAAKGPLRCRNLEWVEQRRQAEVEEIEAAKRAANPTYAALQDWKDAWSKSHNGDDY